MARKLASSPVNLLWPITGSVPCTVQSSGRGWVSSRFPKPWRLGMSSEYGNRAHKLQCEASEGS